MHHDRGTIPRSGSKPRQPRSFSARIPLLQSVRFPRLEIFLGALKIKSSDCGWQSTARDSAGKITWDPKIASPFYRCSEFSLRFPAAAVWSPGARNLRAQSRTQVRCLFRFVCYETSATDKFILICYFSRGIFACDFVGGTAHYVGSLGHETSDAATFASWCVDIFPIYTIKQS
jgi:hypothetical protein